METEKPSDAKSEPEQKTTQADKQSTEGEADKPASPPVVERGERREERGECRTCGKLYSWREVEHGGTLMCSASAICTRTPRIRGGGPRGWAGRAAACGGRTGRSRPGR